MKEIFDNYIETSFGEYKQAEFKFKQFEYNYKKYFPQNKDAKLLDVGIGRGEMLSCFKNWGYHNYLGIDINPSTVNFCKSLGLNCILVENTNEFLRSNPDTFDLITLLDVLEHIPREEIITFLKDLRTALKEGGVLIIQVPNLQAPDGFLHRYNDITHVVGFIEHSLSQVLIAAGFRNFHFHPFEELIDKKLKTYLKKVFRAVYWRYVRFTRAINANLNPKILTPVFYAIAQK